MAFTIKNSPIHDPFTGEHCKTISDGKSSFTIKTSPIHDPFTGEHCKTIESTNGNSYSHIPLSWGFIGLLLLPIYAVIISALTLGPIWLVCKLLGY